VCDAREEREGEERERERDADRRSVPMKRGTIVEEEATVDFSSFQGNDSRCPAAIELELERYGPPFLRRGAPGRFRSPFLTDASAHKKGDRLAASLVDASRLFLGDDLARCLK
jgi:hypothetical protein